MITKELVWICLNEMTPHSEAIVLVATKDGTEWSYQVAAWDDGYFEDAETSRTVEPMPTHWAEIPHPVK
ncbi:hypothetical protein N836_35845 [Leptolyngbya sp. Heron Island J]|uniref:DUF551 domain-containing protein n=1 Tax=Leptolyngbya sp. Heron Island J TaxID=1385935 RepID=UPI0003B9D51D|nr:DUF551 domain-containing protein [Leptolyngbya sp. Heron Island J]ESA37748.1 hypothetical protein N836_35845 [Leptolyngbya sp. Heron Island J]